jgi:hypothetical protein
MNEQGKGRRILRKIWYGTAISLSVLVLLFCTLGVIGTWIFEQTLVNVTQNLLSATAKTAGGLRVVAARIDQDSSELRQVSSAVSAISIKIGQNVEDTGLLATLLPAEQEAKLNASIGKIQDTLSSVREFLTAGISTYRAINRIPFVSLPGLSEDTTSDIMQTVADTQATIEELKQGIQEFRSGVAQGIGRVTQAADRVTQALDMLSAKLAELDRALAALEDLASRLEASVPLAFGLAAVILTIFLVFVGYSQVEVIRVHVRRWKALDTAVLETPAAIEPGQEPPASETEEPPA